MRIGRAPVLETVWSVARATHPHLGMGQYGPFDGRVTGVQVWVRFSSFVLFVGVSLYYC